jgi:hypothetical protein
MIRQRENALCVTNSRQRVLVLILLLALSGCIVV